MILLQNRLQAMIVNLNCKDREPFYFQIITKVKYYSSKAHSISQLTKQQKTNLSLSLPTRTQPLFPSKYYPTFFLILNTMSSSSFSSIPLYSSGNISELSLVGHSLFGYDTELQEFLEVDLKHSIVWPYKIQTAARWPVKSCRFVENCGVGDGQRMAYWVVFEKSVEKISFLRHNFEQGIIRNNREQQNQGKDSTVLTSNSMSGFTGLLDGWKSTLIFTKLHENHLKFSINWLQSSTQQKKIIKLMDSHPNQLILNHYHPQVIYTTQQNETLYFDLDRPQVQTQLTKKSIVLNDSTHIFSTSHNLVTKCNDTFQIQSVDLRTGKVELSFPTTGFPLKLQSFGDDKVVYMTSDSLAVTDRRKATDIWRVQVDEMQEGGSMGSKKTKGAYQAMMNSREHGRKTTRDFLIHPNLGKIYLALTNQVRIVDYEFF